jgi:hypothetical protein
MARRLLVAAALLVACNPTAPAPPALAAEAAKQGPSAPARCSASLDARELLARHARAYGSPEAVLATLPLVMSGTLSLEGRAGKVELVVAPNATRSYAWVGGIIGASGVDAAGAWSLDSGSGAVERQSGVEAIAPVLEAWLLRRSYVTAFDPAKDSARCEDLGSGARVDVSFARPELGSPVLAFDLESGALLSVSHDQADGARTSTTYEAWTELDHGTRWPRKTTEHPLVGSSSTQEYAPAVHGLDCARVDGTGVAIPERGAPCTEPPPPRFVLRWPAGDRPRIRLPFTYLGSELLVRAKLGGREVIAFLDSGAGATAVDATTPAGAEFRPSMQVTGAGATQRIRVGFGELATIDLAELRAEHVPTVSVPIPGLDAFGDKRPELILGYSFFATAVVRVDYKRQEIVLAKSTEGLFAKGGEPRAVPLRVLKNKIIVDGSVEGTPAPFEVDTGNSGGLDLFKKWASAHGLPGSRPVVAMTGHFGAGTEETTSTFYRLARATLGPIAFDGHLSNVSDAPGSAKVAGLAGNEVLARCDAVVFDVAKRTLWLEGPCDRPVPESRAGWRLEKKVDPAHPDRPWVIGALWPGGAAERAGVQRGDRLLEIAGKPATLDVAPIWATEQGPIGTKVPVVVLRPAAPKTGVRLMMELRNLTP